MAGTTVYDVCIVGAGACGAMVAAHLSQAGARVCVIEAGPRWVPERDFVADERNGSHLMFPSTAVATGDGPLGTLGGMGLGGGTVNYRGASYRMSPSDFVLRSTEGIAEDWPFTYEDIAPYYTQAERELHVSGDHRSPWEPTREPYPCPPLAPNCNGEAVALGFRRLGLRYLAIPYATVSKPVNGQPACVYCGFCISGCPINAKSSTLVTHVPIAERYGCEFRTESFASRVELGPHGRVDGVCYFDKNGTEHKIHARAVVLSAFAIETPRLLLNSACAGHPDGLANSSGLVGRYLHGHTSRMTYARFDFPIDRFKGLGGYHTRDRYETDPSQSFKRGFTLMASVGGSNTPVGLAQSRPALWGQALKDFVRDFRYYASISTMGMEAEPSPENRVTVDPDRKDRFGLPTARTVHNWAQNDIDASDAGAKLAEEVMAAAGAKHIYTTPLKSTHVMGSCRMGKDPRRSVVNEFCRAHDVRNLFICDTSVMVTGGAVNPTLTAQAIALRATEHMIQLACRREL